MEALADDRLQRRARHVVTEITRVERSVSAIEAGDWARLGRLFEESHVSMRDDFEISCAELDTSVATAVEAGAIGARMTGGGFGGSSIALVPEERVDAVVRAIDTAFVAAGFAAPAHLLATASAAADVVSWVPPAEHAQGAQRQPAGGLTDAVVHLEPHASRQGAVEQPHAVRSLLAAHVVDRLPQSRVARAVTEVGGGPEVVQGPQHVVAASGWARRTTGTSSSAGSPEPRRRKSCRCRRYSSPARRAARESGVPPVARSCSSSPSSTLIVVWNDERVEPLGRSQFQPPSSSRSPTSRSTIGDMSTPK